MSYKKAEGYYNKDKKILFLEEVDDTYATQTLFEVSSLYEAQCKADLCIVPLFVIENIMNNNFGISKKENRKILRKIRLYVEWCSKKGDECNYSIMSYEPDLGLKYRMKTVESPKHLVRILNDYYEVPSEEYKMNEIDRAYLWMLYSGIQIKDAPYVMRSDVDLEKLTIKHNNTIFQIYTGAVEDFKRASERSIHLNKVREKAGKKCIDYFLAGYHRNTLLPGHASERMKEKIENAKPYMTPTKCTPNSIYESGVFYRLYCEELLIGKLKSKDYIRIGNSREIKADYLEWKKAFGL